VKVEEREASISVYLIALILRASFSFHMTKARNLCKLCAAIFSTTVEYWN